MNNILNFIYKKNEKKICKYVFQKYLDARIFDMGI